MQKRQDKVLYSLVIPAYKEEAILHNTLKEVRRYLRRAKQLGVTEIIVVAANGNDATAQIAKKHKKSFQHFSVIEPGPKVGKGRDVKLGVLAAKGKYIAFTDADLATPINHLSEMWRELEAGKDIVIGIRNLREIHTGYRAAVSVCSNALTRAIVLPGIPDTQCGFKGFRKEIAQTIFNKQHILGWGFDIELLVIARQHRYSISQIEIPDWHDPKLENGLVGESGLSAVISTLLELIKIRFNKFRRYYQP
jgi:dolichyl-phosphate beta-glucosyltransferase